MKRAPLAWLMRFAFAFASALVVVGVLVAGYGPASAGAIGNGTAGGLGSGGAPGGGAASGGDVVGPASSTDTALARFDLTTGKLLQDGVLLSADTTGALSVASGAVAVADDLTVSEDSSLGDASDDITAVRGTMKIGGATFPGAFSPVQITNTDASSTNVGLHSYSATAAHGSSIALEHARGTAASPTALSVGDYLGVLKFNGFTSTRIAGAEIRATAATGYGASGADAPTDLSFLLVPDGSNTVAEVMSLNSNGKLGLGIAVPTSDLHLYSATAVKTVAIAGTDGAASTSLVASNGSQSFGVYARGAAQAGTVLGLAAAGAVHMAFGATNGVAIGTSGDVPLLLSQNNTERMRLAAGGGITYATWETLKEETSALTACSSTLNMRVQARYKAGTGSGICFCARDAAAAYAWTASHTSGTFASSDC